jgi:MFS family permease
VPFVRDNFLLIALAILGTNVAMAIFRSPTIAFLGDLFRPTERSKANGVINLMGGVGGALALFAGGALYSIGVPVPFIVGAGVMLIAIAVVLLFVRDDPTAGEGVSAPEASPGLRASLREVATDRNRSGVFLLAAIFSWFVGWNATEAFFTLYARNILGMEVGAATQMLTVFAAALILFAIPSGLIATRFGRKPTIIVGLAGMAAGVIVATLVRNATVLLAVLGVMGAFWALVNINSLPMVYDLTKSGSIGAYTGLYYFASSLAAIVGPTVAGGLIDLTNHRVIWPFTAVFLLLAIVFMSRVRPQQLTAA